MFNKLTESLTGKKQWYKPGSLLPILSANALLCDRRYSYYTEQVKLLAALPEDHFNHFYLGVIQRFAEFVQVIPRDEQEPLCSLLINSLLVSLNTLHQFVQEFDKASPLERFALFTACLFQEVAYVYTQYKILITDEQGSTKEVWQPFCGSLCEQDAGTHFKLMSLSSAFERLDKGLRVPLARQVMGESGFLWIASDMHVLMEWLLALQDEDGEEVSRLLKAIKLYRRQGVDLFNGLPVIPIEELASPATEYADKFLEWLAKGIRDGEIKINKGDAEVHMTEAGVFVEMSAILKTFSEKFKLPGAVVFAQLGRLLVGRQGGGDFESTKILSDYVDRTSTTQSGFASPLGRKTGMMREGILLPRDILSDLPVSQHVRLPATFKASGQALANFNPNQNTNPTVKHR